ncbi:hypothetical protein L226DRAFT_612333 [Lentinus tigrinus ALCF2SS1-7]|uniref:DUF6593 domain-containing protein n=1 Tax=Lentinus tigrinus ALCF2SS1-6 TaxID=1328759 RepID=A0A5C2SJP2_9APHY|nr:hypothetical protein L227DRAFT_610124 [Lentinus tigrinus ALCF2SS1-6]RPD76094.1 hypothetical protein L226DRAFT_612333 [Lentinus tigrinus ALCF2SS1-7]
MNISFTKRDPLNSAVVDDATGQVIFEVSTTPWWKLANSTTTIRDPGGQVLAEYERRLFGHGKVTVRATTSRMKDWLPKKKWWSSHRMLTTPDGRVYIWKCKTNGTFKLIPIDSESETPVVETRKRTLGLFKPRRKGGMSVHSELTPFLIDILLSFIVCERERRAEEAARNSSS